MDDSMVIDFEGTELTAVNDLLERTQQRLLEETAKETEQYLRQAIEVTDWSVTTVLDVVTKNVTDFGSIPAESSLEMSHATAFQVYRYRKTDHVPSDSAAYASGVPHGLRVYRITEQVCREVGIDPETGCDVDD